MILSLTNFRLDLEVLKYLKKLKDHSMSCLVMSLVVAQSWTNNLGRLKRRSSAWKIIKCQIERKIRDRCT